MSDLILTARCEGRNDRHAYIGVFQNGGKAGGFTVEAEHEQAVLGAINAHAELLAACKASLRVVGCYTLGSEDAAQKKPAELLLRAAIAKAEGE